MTFGNFKLPWVEEGENTATKLMGTETSFPQLQGKWLKQVLSKLQG